MIFKKKEKKEKPVKEKKVSVMKVGTHKKTVIALWLVLIASVSFGVYKNFTAIDMHTVHEKEVIEQHIIDTNRIENFVKGFAKSYHAWSNTQESIDARTAAISNYLTKGLQDLNTDTVRKDIPTSSTVTNVQIWNVEQTKANDFTAIYSVDQTVTEGDQSKQYTSAYEVVVHADDNGNMVITKNPTICSLPTKSSYEPKTQEVDVNVDAATIEEVTEFLETFFKLYPTATEKELSYYVAGNVLEPVNTDYVFSELVNPVFTQDGDNIKVSVSVSYLDQRTKATQISQFDLVLEKTDSNWKIVG
ncbi:MAG: conjugal transfer protein [Anaerostipes sp.]|nr:conjugal transfer protein [Anaerostipes sp.]